jgi:hypothetical protein
MDAMLRIYRLMKPNTLHNYLLWQIHDKIGYQGTERSMRPSVHSSTHVLTPLTLLSTYWCTCIQLCPCNRDDSWAKCALKGCEIRHSAWMTSAFNVDTHTRFQADLGEGVRIGSALTYKDWSNSSKLPGNDLGSWHLFVTLYLIGRLRILFHRSGRLSKPIARWSRQSGPEGYPYNIIIIGYPFLFSGAQVRLATTTSI